MKNTLILVFLFCVSTIQVFSQNQNTVRFDGLYQTETSEESDLRAFLRFYADSSVISTTTTGEATDVIKWLKKPYDNQGKFEIKGNKLYFTTTSSYGTVVYEGIIESEYRLILKTKSLINGYVDEKSYYFIKL